MARLTGQNDINFAAICEQFVEKLVHIAPVCIVREVAPIFTEDNYLVHLSSVLANTWSSACKSSWGRGCVN
jgi:hypothetical protein